MDAIGRGFDALVTQRRSIRGFLGTPVPGETLRELLALARRAPSGANLQPGSFLLVEGAARQRLSEELVRAFRAGEEEAEDYDYFPRPMPMALRKRQVASAQALYGALGIARDDRAGRDAQFERNFNFFGAPAALVVTIERGMGAGCFMDLGMCLHGLMLAAQSRGLSTCAIGAIASYPTVVRRELGLDDRSLVVCGLALGHADPQAPANATQTERCGVDEFFRVIR